jgi:putative oxidoreductase
MGDFFRGHLGWAFIRVTFGFSLAFFHGYGKVIDGGVYNLAGTVAKLGFPAPTFLAWCAALTELAGGILFGFGLGTRPVAILGSVTMTVALYRHLSDPVAKMELALLYLSVMLVGAAIGGGRYSLDALFRLRLPVAPRGGA